MNPPPDIPPPLVSVSNLSVRYGCTHAVRGLSFEISRGEIFGFIGPNGAGKTSTIKVLATLLKPTEGFAKVGGLDVAKHPHEVRRKIGYMPDFFGVYDDLTAKEYLHFFAAAYKIPGGKRSGIVADVLALTDLTAKADAAGDGLSRGMKQRLGLARVLLHDPDLLLLDEPASGLDPRARIEMRELLKELQSMGKRSSFRRTSCTSWRSLARTSGSSRRGRWWLADRCRRFCRVRAAALRGFRGDQFLRAEAREYEPDECDGRGARDVHGADFSSDHRHLPFPPGDDGGAHHAGKGARFAVAALPHRVKAVQILLQKLCRGLVAILSFMLIGMPLGALCYAYGGVPPEQLFIGVWVLFLTCLQVAAFALMCSSRARTTVGAFIGTYVGLAALFLNWECLANC